MSSQDTTTVEQFFLRYGEALASGDLEGVADAYGYPSLVLGGPETILVSERADVVGAFSGAAEQHREQGFVRAVPDVRVLDDGAVGTLWVDVVWTYSSEDGSQQQLDRYRYLLRRSDGGLSIAALAPAPTGGEQ